MAFRRRNRPMPVRRRTLHVKKGDKVYVLSGVDKGKGPAEVIKVFPELGKVLVQGVNVHWKHTRPSQREPKGGRVQREFPIPASKVLLYSGKTGKGVRVRHVIKDGRKIRVGTCGTEF